MKSILKYAIASAIVFTTFFLTACSGQPNFDVRLSNGSDVAIELDGISITNQELLELVASGGTDWNSGVSIILEWVDSIILPDLVEFDEAPIIRQEELLLELEEDELMRALVANGFSTLQEALDSHRLRLMREQAVLDSIVYTDEELYEIFNDLFAPAEGQDVDDEDIPTFDDIRDDLESFLISQRLDIPGYVESTLARLRDEAGMVIYSEYFATHYTNSLNDEFTDEIEVATSTSTRNIASVTTASGTQYFEIDDFFQAVLLQYAFAEESPLLDYLNLQVLDSIYNVSRRTINDNITEAKINLLDWFYPQMEMMGLTTEEAIFDWFWLIHLQNLAFNDYITLDDARVEYLHTNYTPARDTSHILVDDYDFALELIGRLQAASANEMNDLFAELAMEYSTCPSGVSGGELGNLSLPSGMVQEFEDATFALAEGTFSTTPVESQFGYHIILVENFDSIPSLSTIRTEEMSRLRDNPDYLNGVMFTLRAEHNIVIHNDLLQTRYNALLEANRRNTTN